MADWSFLFAEFEFVGQEGRFLAFQSSPLGGKNIIPPSGRKSKGRRVASSPELLHTWGTPTAGIEPATVRLTAGCSTAELSRITNYSIDRLSHWLIRSGKDESGNTLSLLSRTSFGSSSTPLIGYSSTSPVSCVVQTCTGN